MGRDRLPVLARRRELPLRDRVDHALISGLIAHIRDERSRLQSVTAADVQARWESSIPLQRLGTPEDVAEVVAFLLSEASRYITGEQIGVAGGTDGS